MKISKNELYENKNFIFCLIISLTITCICITILYKNSITDNKPIEEKILPFAEIVNDINTCNLSLKDCINNSTLDTKVTPDILSNCISNLEKSKRQLLDLTFTDDLSLSISEKILLSINSTIDLYSLCLNYLKSNDKSSVDNLVDNMDTLRNSCIDNYDSLSSYGLTLTYSDPMNEFLSTFIKYLSTLNKLAKEDEIKKGKILDFKNNITIAVNDFSNILQDLKPAVTKIREDNRTFDALLNDLSIREEKFNTIKETFTHSSIPDGYISYYNSLKDIFDLYSSYLASIRTAVIYETSSSGYNENKSSIDKNYNNAYSKLNDVEESLKDFKKFLEDL